MTLSVGQKKTLKVKNTKKKVSWKSNKKSVATVTKKGIVQGKSAGTAKITAKVSGKKLICRVTVKAKSNKGADANAHSISFQTTDGGDFVAGISVINISFQLDAKSTNVKAQILDVTDHILYTKTFPSCKQNTVKTFSWNGKNNAGAYVGDTTCKVQIIAGKTKTVSTQYFRVLTSSSTGFAGGNGSVGNPYQVSNLAQLRKVGTSSTRCFVQTANGSIVPAVKTWYYHIEPDSGYWIGQTEPSGQEGEIIRQEYIYKDSSIVIDGKTVVFHIYDYALIYSEQIMKQYLDANIRPDMTDYEKAEICCKFVAGYDYGTESTSYSGMIITGSGDCWASTGTLRYLFQQLGIPAISRSASHDPGAGSGHYNVLAILDGYYYIVEAGYVGTAPRKYSIKRLSSGNQPYVYSVLSEREKTACITSYYDFAEYCEKVIQIPREIDGYTITEIGNKAFCRVQEAEKIILPNTIKSIGNSAFAECEKLQSIEIPDSVVSMGKSVFYRDKSLTSLRIPASVEELTGGMFQNCQSLKEIIVDEQNTHYCSVDGVLFDKSMKTLISYPPGKTDAEYDVPEGVDVIGEWSFASCGCYSPPGQTYVINNGFQKLILPGSLRTISENAFLFTWVKEVQVSNGITEISYCSFRSARIE